MGCAVDRSAAYQIDGGRSGSEAKAPDNVIPIPAMSDSSLIGIMLSSQLRSAGALLALDGEGMIVGIVAGGAVAAPEVATAIALLEVLWMLMTMAQSLSTVIDQTYPRDPTGGKRWRKYTKWQKSVLESMVIYASPFGTFGDSGIHVADGDAELARGVTCITMDPLDIATRFQLPNKDVPPDNSEVTGYIEIIELRKNYLTVNLVGINTAGQKGYMILKPLVSISDTRRISRISTYSTCAIINSSWCS